MTGRTVRRRAATAGLLSLALAFGTAAPAHSQDPDSVLGSLGDSGLEAIAGSVGLLPIGSTAGVIGSIGSADFPITGGSVRPVSTPTQVDPTITTTRFLGIDRYSGPNWEYEYWSIQSAAMQRVVTVEVARSPDPGESSVLYMLDGATTALRTTGWNDMAHIHSRMAGRNVHVVNPMAAFGSFYSDWESEDPVLGNHKWETFLTRELPPIVHEQLSTNDTSIIAGNSMGAQAAMHLTARYPDLYDGVIALSGNYSTTDPLGYLAIRMTVEGYGGNLDNMWGPRGSERWRYHDTISHAEKLRGKPVYMSAGNGVFGPDDAPHYAGSEIAKLMDIVLERGVLESTKAFERALQQADVEYAVDYHATGLHNWTTFTKTFDEGWEYVMSALEARPAQG